MNRALIIGVDSSIGSHLYQNLHQAGWDVYATTRRQSLLSHRFFFLDLSDISLPLKHVPSVDVVFLCASITTIAQSQALPSYAKVINQDAQIVLTEYFLKLGCHVIFLSTNAVFDGKQPFYPKHSKVNPVTLYGQYKAAVEQQLMLMSGMISIIRFSKVISQKNSLMQQWVSTLRKGLCIYPFDDLFLCPISIRMASDCLKTIAENSLFGIMHLSGEKDITYYEWALCLANHLAIDLHLVKPKSMLNDTQGFSGQGPFGSLDMQESYFNIKDLSVKAVLQDSFLPGDEIKYS